MSHGQGPKAVSIRSYTTAICRLLCLFFSATSVPAGGRVTLMHVDGDPQQQGHISKRFPLSSRSSWQRNPGTKQGKLEILCKFRPNQNPAQPELMVQVQEATKRS